MTPEQQKQIDSMKKSVHILSAVARNCSDLEVADEVTREANNIAAKLAVVEGTPRTAAAGTLAIAA